jgi:hypothetical protein
MAYFDKDIYFYVPKKYHRIIRSQLLHLFFIALSVRANQRIYDRLNVSLKPEDNRGEAWYATCGEHKIFIELAEQGVLPPEYFAEVLFRLRVSAP